MISLRTWPLFRPPARTKGKEKTTTDDLVCSCGSTLGHAMLRMWEYLICIVGPIAAAISLFSTRPDEVEWIEYNHVDAQPNARREPMPDYDDPFLRRDHPFWKDKPPAEVIAGEHGWNPPRLEDLPPVARVTRRTQVKAVPD